MDTQLFRFADSPFVPVAIGFFGLGTGYFNWGWAGVVWISQDKSGSEFQLVTGIWLMYCTYGMTVDVALGAKARI